MSYIKSLLFLAITYAVIVIGLITLGGWEIAQALTFINAEESGVTLLIFVIICCMISAFFKTKSWSAKKLIGYILLPLAASAVFIIFYMLKTDCATGTMGCGLDTLVAMGFGILVFIMLSVNFKIASVRPKTAAR